LPTPEFREQYWEAEPNADDAKGQEMAKKMRGKRLPMVGRIEFYVIEENATPLAVVSQHAARLH
jgi:hypothetical protein